MLFVLEVARFEIAHFEAARFEIAHLLAVRFEVIRFGLYGLRSLAFQLLAVKGKIGKLSTLLSATLP